MSFKVIFKKVSICFHPVGFWCCAQSDRYFLIIQKCKPLFVGLSSLRNCSICFGDHGRQRTWPFELKVRFNSPIFAMFKTSSCQESKKNQKRRRRQKIGRVSSHPEFLASLSITWLISRAFWHFSEETRCLLLRHREEESVLGQVHHVCISQWYSLLKA